MSKKTSFLANSSHPGKIQDKPSFPMAALASFASLSWRHPGQSQHMASLPVFHFQNV
ncbi:MAG TPA: hypothetical protein PKC21_03680 [Oligoflexia bacterium]|nr:hypothetical protein [Oligoflexia bacterium]